MCGEPATELVAIYIGSRSVVQNLCDPHLAQLLNGARPADGGHAKETGAVLASVIGSTVPSIVEQRRRRRDRRIGLPREVSRSVMSD